MISLRYHVISITAVFLALAIGVVLGSTTLSNTLLSGLSGQKEQLGKQVSDLQAQNSSLRSRLASGEQFAKGVGPLAVRGALDKRTVAVITTSSAKPADRDALTSLIKSAGGSVTAQVQLTDAFSDPAKADRLRDLVTRMIPAGAQLPTASDPGTLAGGLLGDLLLLNKANNKPQANPNEIASAISGLTDGGFLTASGNVAPAQLAIVLTGGGLHGDGAADRASTLAHFAAQMQRSGAGTVLAGTSGSAGGSGALGVVRADTAASSILSTVDDADTAAGQVTTVLALRAQLNSQPGRFGTAGNAQAAIPGGGAAG
ncbi:MAG: copper transporter [Sciscionella sp.]